MALNGITMNRCGQIRQPRIIGLWYARQFYWIVPSWSSSFFIDRILANYSFRIKLGLPWVGLAIGLHRPWLWQHINLGIIIWTKFMLSIHGVCICGSSYYMEQSARFKSLSKLVQRCITFILFFYCMRFLFYIKLKKWHGGKTYSIKIIRFADSIHEGQVQIL